MISDQTYKKHKALILQAIDLAGGLLTNNQQIIPLLKRIKELSGYSNQSLGELITYARKENGINKNLHPKSAGKFTERPEPETIFPQYENVNHYFEDFEEGWYKIRKPYVLPAKDMKIGVLSDIHIANHVRPAVMIALQEIKSKGCDTIILNGDTLDCESLGFWRHRPDKNLFRMEVDHALNFFTGLRKMFPKEKIIFKQGNHEERVQHTIIDKNPELYGMISIEEILKLKEFGIESVEEKQIIKCGELNIIHGHEVRMSFGAVNLARTMFLKTQVNILFGHFHTAQEYISTNLDRHSHGAWAVGCLCDLSPDYNPYANNWAHGFAIVEKKASGMFTVSNKKIINGTIL